MNPSVFGLVTLAAIFHASWNAVLRGGDDRHFSMVLMMAAIAGVTGVMMFFVPWPSRSCWPCMLATVVVHVGYNLSLVRTYRSGDLGQTYPISRGSSPVLVTLGAAVFAHETLAVVSYLGIALVSAGIISLAFQGKRLRTEFLPSALVTGVLIGSYSVIDGMGVRLSGNSWSYMSFTFFLWSAAQIPIYLLSRQKLPRYTARQVSIALVGGLVSLLAYGIVIWAMNSVAMGAVSALRETSVVYAAIIGWLFLRERLTTRRILSCVAIAAGAACLAL